MFGPAYPPGGAFITTQPVRSAFELEWNAQLPANQEYLLTGRSWSGGRPIARTEISTDGGRRWHPAIPRDPGTPAGKSAVPDRSGVHGLEGRSGHRLQLV